jgi:hypothetical protein
MWWHVAALCLAVVFAPELASAQNIQPSGQFTVGHGLRCLNPNCTAAGDAGGANGAASTGPTAQKYLTEIGITNTGSPFCINDALIDSPSGYHQFCLGANALGGALLSFNAYGGASPLPLQCNINGVVSSCFGGGNVSGPGSATVGHIVTFNNSAGTLLADSGIALSSLRTVQTATNNNLQFYVNKNSGNSDNNDCLSATFVSGTHGPCATINHGWFVMDSTVDSAGYSPPNLNVGCGTYIEQVNAGGAVVGSSELSITGAGSGCVTIEAPNAQYAITIQDYAAMHLFGVTLACAAGASGEVLVYKYGIYDSYGDVKYTACTGAFQITAYQFGTIFLDAANSFDGSAAGAIAVGPAGQLVTGNGFAITVGAASVPTYSLGFIYAYDGANLSFGTATITGTIVGPKYAANNNVAISTNGTDLNTVLALSGGTTGILKNGSTGDWITNTWTPVLRGSGTAGSVTYTTNVGSYEQIGQQFTARFTLVTSALTSATGNWEITGLPGITSSIANNNGVCSIGTYSGVTFDSGYTQFTAYVGATGSSGIINLVETGSTENGKALSITSSNFAAATTLIGSCTYTAL